MIRKTTPIISQSNVELLSKKEISPRIFPSNSVYFKRYPYKIVFKIEVAFGQHLREQQKNFELDLMGFIEDMLSDPVRKHIASRTPSLFITSYTDVLTTLAAYGDAVSYVCGPVSDEHLDLLFSPNLLCESKSKLWYNKYDCKIESWLPLTLRLNLRNNYDPIPPDEVVMYLKENIDVHVTKHRFRSFCSTMYCSFDEFVNILPFVKMVYPENRLVITKAILDDQVINIIQ